MLVNDVSEMGEWDVHDGDKIMQAIAYGIEVLTIIQNR